MKSLLPLMISYDSQSRTPCLGSGKRGEMSIFENIRLEINISRRELFFMIFVSFIEYA